MKNVVIKFFIIILFKIKQITFHELAIIFFYSFIIKYFPLLSFFFPFNFSLHIDNRPTMIGKILKSMSNLPIALRGKNRWHNQRLTTIINFQTKWSGVARCKSTWPFIFIYSTSFTHIFLHY